MQGISISGSRVSMSRRGLVYASLILVFCVLSAVRYGLLMYAGQIIFLFCVLLNYDMLKIRTTHFWYLAPFVLYTLFAALSYVWCSNTNLYFSAMRSIIQITVISLSVFMVMSSSDDPTTLFEKAVYFSGWAIIVYAVLKTSPSEWGKILKETVNLSSDQNRFGYSIGMHPNSAGFSISMFLIFDVYYYARTKKKHVILQILSLAVLLALTKSRTPMLILAGGLLLFVVLYKRMSIKHVVTILCAAAGVVVLIYVSLKVDFLFKIYGARLKSLLNIFSGEGTDASVTGRLRLQEMAIQAFKKDPVKGVGIGNFAFFNDVGRGTKGYYAHNNYCELLADIGFVGTVLYYLPFVSTLVALLYKLKNDSENRMILSLLVSVIAMILVGDFGEMSYLSDSIHCMLAVCASYAFGVYFKKTPEGSPIGTKER